MNCVSGFPCRFCVVPNFAALLSSSADQFFFSDLGKQSAVVSDVFGWFAQSL